MRDIDCLSRQSKPSLQEKCFGEPCCVVTPKVDGMEAFLVGYGYGVAVLFRDGSVQSVKVVDPSRVRRCTPFLMEGEYVSKPDRFVAYDVIVTPVSSYVNHGRHLVRQAVLKETIRKIGNLLQEFYILHKPSFPFVLSPYSDIRLCRNWALETGINCDGVIFADSVASGYIKTPRLWKLKIWAFS